MNGMPEPDEPKINTAHKKTPEDQQKEAVLQSDGNDFSSQDSRGFCRFGMRSIGKILLQCAGIEYPCTVTPLYIST